MKAFISLLSMCAMISGYAQTQPIPDQTEQIAPKEHSGECLVALQFINDYADFCNHTSGLKEESAWIQRNQLLTADFKKTYKAIIQQNRKKEFPEADPVFDAQDFPDEFELAQCDGGFVTVKGVEWEDFKVVLKVVKYQNQWLVEGCGIVNIPAEKRAVR